MAWENLVKARTPPTARRRLRTNHCWNFVTDSGFPLKTKPCSPVSFFTRVMTVPRCATLKNAAPPLAGVCQPAPTKPLLTKRRICRSSSPNSRAAVIVRFPPRWRLSGSSPPLPGTKLWAAMWCRLSLMNHAPSAWRACSASWASTHRKGNCIFPKTQIS